MRRAEVGLIRSAPGKVLPAADNGGAQRALNEEHRSGIAPAMHSVLVHDQSGLNASRWSRELGSAGVHAVPALDEGDARGLLAARSFQIVIVSYDASSVSSDFPSIFRAAARDGSLVAVVENLSAEHALALRPHADLILPGPIQPSTLLRAVEILGDEGDDVTRFARERKLSPREAELLRHALAGLNNDEAAAALGCSRATVASFWNRIFRKIGVSGQRDVIVELLRSGRRRNTARGR